MVSVIAKAPRAGASKTRLCPPLAPHEAASLASAFLEDTIAVALAAEVDVRLMCRDETERPALARFAGDRARVAVQVQDGQGLGAALESAFWQGAAEGYDAVGVLGTDVPTLPPDVIVEAFERLAEADVVLGPSLDGGYYLLTARRPHAALFREMVWGTAAVAEETCRRCAALGLRLETVAEWDDVDDPAALARLTRSLETADPTVAPRTRRVLMGLALDASGGHFAPSLPA